VSERGKDRGPTMKWRTKKKEAHTAITHQVEAEQNFHRGKHMTLVVRA